MAPNTLISHAKISRPATTAYYASPRIFQRLDDLKSHSVIWISAPAGFGKSSLVNHYVNRRGLPCLWYQLDAGDDDVASFFYCLRAAVCEEFEVLDVDLPVFRTEHMASLSSFARRFFNELFAVTSEPYVLVLDNYHELSRDAALHAILCEAFSTLPSSITVYVTSRELPPLLYSSLLASSAMVLVDRETLSLSFEETVGVCHTRSNVTDLGIDDVRALYEISQGWVAGLILLLSQGKIECKGKNTADALFPTDMEMVFGYFASESFSKYDDKIRHLLLQTAFFEKFTADMAERLCGVPDAQEVLDGMCRGNYFLIEHRGDGVLYSYHPLYRDFLLARLKKEYAEEDLVALRDRSAELSLERGHVSQAAGLFRENASWRRLARLILEYAPLMSQQGRNGTALTWLKWLPDRIVEEDPWLSYWHGIFLFPFQSEGGRNLLIKAFSGFREKADRQGQLLSVAAIIETIIFEWGYFKTLDHWIDEMERLLADEPRYSSGEQACRVAYAMFIALFNRQPSHPELPRWFEEVWSISLRLPDLPLRLTVASHVLIYLVWWRGDLGRARLLIDALQPIAGQEDIPPLARITWQTMQAGYLWMGARNEEALELIEKNLQLADETGIHLWDALLYCQGAITALSDENLEKAAEYLRKMASSVADARPLDHSMYHYVAAWKYCLESDVQASCRALQVALEMAEQAGCVFFRGIVRAQLGLLTWLQGDHEAGFAILHTAEEEGRHMNTETVLCQATAARAECALRDGDEASCYEYMRQCVDISKAGGILNRPWWRADVMSRLLARVLDRGYEMTWVRSLIQRRGLAPPSDGCDLERWPWPVRIYTLGRFEILRDGEPLRITGKAKKRPLQLLKLMIALGGRDVSAVQVIDILWPDASGDDAMESLRVTVGRLRRLLQCREAVVYAHGRLSLEARRCCFVDCWAFERLLGRSDVDEACQEKALRLYQGAFLKAEPDAAWALPLRESLRAKYRDLVLATGRRLEAAGDWQASASLYEQGVRVDETAEVFYQKLMTCYARLGRSSDVAAVFHRCEKILMTTLGISPSAQTLSIFRHCADNGPA